MVALIGRVNVGKSTLFNRLLRTRRALVEDRPGVTRDAVAAPAEIEGRALLLVDTGGLDPEAEEGIPAAVAAQVHRVLEDAAVILFVVDGREGPLPLDTHIARLLRRAGGRVVVVVNKADGPRETQRSGEFHALGLGEPLPVSAEHRLGIPDLELAIAERLPELRAEPAKADAYPRLAIVGRPNVGKSSLVNRLLGSEDALVSEEPGTTRDATDRRLRFGEEWITLVDTAGLRRPGRREDRLERGSALMALRSIERADVAILLVDAAEGVTEQDAKIARLALDCGRPLVIGLNKWDLVEGTGNAEGVQRAVERRLRFVPDAVVVRTSACTGRGASRLVREALRLRAESRRRIPTAELNRALAIAFERNVPPMRGRRRARFFYATQVSDRPFTCLLFVNDPELFPRHYRRYLESYLRRTFGLASGPVRVRLRARSRRDDADADA
jgi:GTP-binding protein